MRKKSFKTRLTEITAALEQSFTKDELTSKFLTKAKKVVSGHLVILINEGADINDLKPLLTTKAPSKEKLTFIIAHAFITKKTYQAFLALQAPEIQKLWNELIWQTQMSTEEINKKLGIVATRTVVKYGTYKSAELEPGFNIFKDIPIRQYSYYNTGFVLLIPLPLRQLLQQHHELPQEAYLVPLDETSPTQYEYLNGEQHFFQEWPKTMAYSQQGQISYTAKKRATQNTLPKIQRILAIQEFFPKDADAKNRSTLKTAMFANLAQHFPVSYNLADIPLTVRVFLQLNYQKSFFSTAPIVLTDLKGMGYLEGYDFLSIEHHFFQLFKSLPIGKWISFENIYNHVKYSNYDFGVVRRYVAGEKLYYEVSDSTYTRYGFYADANLYPFAIEDSFLRGSFFLFAAFGLCDLKYDDIEVNELGRSCFSTWDGLRFVRRTALGDFVCGLSNTYDASGIAKNNQLLLSTDTLLITIEGSENSIGTLLDPYAERIGPNRYKTDGRSFLKNVQNIKELNAKINLFKQIVGQELPPNWIFFFDDLQQKINPFIKPEEFEIFKIPPQNKALIQLIAHDATLKKLVVKAEGYLILVAKTNMGAFKKRLQEFGYFF
jgi:hypothetical protein